MNKAACLPSDAAPKLRIDPATALVHHYEDLLRNLAHRVGCPDLAADCLQDTWLQLAQRPQCKPVNNAQAYVYRMACNRAVDILRRERRYVHDDALVTRLGEEIADAAPGPEHLASMRQELRHVLHEIEKMPRQRQAICMDIWLKETSKADVARRFGVTLAAVSSSVRAVRTTAHALY